MGEEAKDIPVLKSENFKEYLPESPAADYPNVVLQPLNTRQVFCAENALGGNLGEIGWDKSFKAGVPNLGVPPKSPLSVGVSGEGDMFVSSKSNRVFETFDTTSGLIRERSNLKSTYNFVSITVPRDTENDSLVITAFKDRPNESLGFANSPDTYMAKTFSLSTGSLNGEFVAAGRSAPAGDESVLDEKIERAKQRFIKCMAP